MQYAYFFKKKKVFVIVT